MVADRTRTERATAADGTPIAEREFIAYAQAQAAYGQHLLAVHRRDSANDCRMCGRPHPCDQRTRGGQLLIHFDHWHPVEAQLVRPYVRDDTGTPRSGR